MYPKRILKNFSMSALHVRKQANPPLPLVVVQALALKAEAAYRLELYGEISSVASRLGGHHKGVDEQIKKINYGNV